METPLTVLYTARLQGELAFAPRLFTFLRSLRAQAAGVVLLLDLGDACHLQVWHCAVTGGRSALFALDAMGYDAVHAGILHPSSRAAMQQAVRVALLGPGEAARLRSARLFVPPLPVESNPARLSIALEPAAQTALADGALSLGGVEFAQVGFVQIAFGRGGASLEQAAVLDVPADTAPDPTVAGAVDFILAEAHLALKKAQGRHNP
jgi:hypothetical protein